MRLVFVQPAPYYYPWYPPNFAALLGWMSSRHPGWETYFYPMRPWADDELAHQDRSKWEHPWHQGRRFASLWNNGAQPSFDDAPESFRAWLDREAEQIARLSPGCVGIGTSLGDWMYGLPLAARLRELMPAVRLIGGGPHLTMLVRLACQNGFGNVGAVLARIFDAVVEAEGEAALSAIVGAVENGGALTRIPGVHASRGGALEAPVSVAKALRLDELPPHRFDLFPTSLYTTPTLETSRGCVSNCLFCSVRSYWPGFRVKPADRLRAEIDEYLEAFPSRPDIRFVDTTLNPRVPAVRELFGYFREVGPIGWSSFVRIEDLSEPILDLFADSGCRQLLFGVESGDAQLLSGLGKRHTVSDSERVLRGCVSRGIVPVPSVIIGLPDETPQSAEATIDFAERLAEEHGCSEFIVEEFLPVPGSPYVEGGRIPLHEILSESPDPDAMPIGPHVWYHPQLVDWRGEAHRRARRFARRVDFFPTQDLGLR